MLKSESNAVHMPRQFYYTSYISNRDINGVRNFPSFLFVFFAYESELFSTYLNSKVMAVSAAV